MAVSQSQIVDLLYKQAFGVTKTDTATNKSPSNESIPSPLLNRGDTLWSQADQIPDVAAGVSGIVQAYTGASAVQCVADNTTVPISGIYPTWKTNLTYWIPAEFGATYSVKVWVDNPGVANPTSTGTQIFADGSGGNGQFYYNYQSGVLNFIGETIPAALTSGKVLYIVGYRYIGLVGVTNLPSNTNIGNLNFTGSTISSTDTDGNIIFTPDGTGIVLVSSDLTSNANVTANFFIGNGSQLTGVAASNALSAGTVTDNAQPNITSVGTLVSLDVTGNVSAGNANLGNLAIANFFSGDGSLLSNITGGNVVGNVSTAVTANFANYAGNVTVNAQPNITSVGTLTSLDVAGNITGNNISTTGSGGNITGANVVSANTFSGNLLATTANINGNLISLNANLGNLVVANFFQGDGGYLTNVAAGNAATSGTVTDNAQPNITSVGTLVSLDVEGNITAGNANLGNLVIANFFSGNGNLLSNITGSNIVGNVTSAITANFANYAGNVTVNAQPNITSVGALTGLDVAGHIIPTVNVTYDLGNSTNRFRDLYLSGNTINLDGSQISANSSQVIITNPEGGTFIVGGNGSVNSADLTGYSIANGNSNVSVIQNGNVTINVTSVPNVVVVTTTGANITGTINATGNANVANLGTTDLIATGSGSFGANVNMNTYWINNVGYPNISTDVATKAYVDTMVSSGISYHEPVLVATTTTLAIATSGTTAYVEPNGAGNGIGAYISTTGTYLNIDGANVQTVGTRILVKNEANATWNGVYTYANNTAIVRASDADEYGSDSAEQFSINDYFFTTGGVVNEGTGFIVSGPTGVITFGTSNITFSIFTTAQVYEAGTGLTLTGTTFSISNTAVTTGSYGDGDTVATFTVNSQGQLTAASNAVITANAANLTGTILASSIVTTSITSVGNLISLDVTGNIVSGNVYANSGTIGANLLTGTLTTAAQPNITSTGTLTGLDVNGDITAANITANTGIFTGNGSGLTDIVGANVTGEVDYAAVANSVAGSNVTGQVGNALIAGTVYTNAQPNITSVGTLTNLTVTGNITGGNLTTGGQVVATGNGTFGNISTTGSGGNISGANNISANTLTGTLTTAAQPNITSLGLLTELAVSGTSNLGPVGNVVITGGSSGYYLQTNGSGVLSWAAVPTGTGISNGTSNVDIATINGNITMSVGGNANIVVVTGTGTIINGIANVTGNLTASNANLGNLVEANYFQGSGANLSNIAGGNVTGQVGNALISGTVYTNAQPNITSLGNLTGITVEGVSNLGPVGNVVITGGTANYYLQTNGAGNLSWAAIPTGTGIANGTSNVNIPTADGNITMSVGGNANVTLITGTGVNVAGTLNATGNIIGGNVNTSGTVTASRLISNVATGTAPLTVTSTTQVANLNVATAGTVTSSEQPNITSTGTLTGLTISGNLIANTFQMGYNTYAFYATSVYFATTASIAENQILWSAPASEISAIDFTIIATDDFDSTRQTCKISAAILGTTVEWNEYGGLYINGGVGSFSVVYNASTSSVDLIVTPDASNLTEYNIMISKYLV